MNRFYFDAIYYEVDIVGGAKVRDKSMLDRDIVGLKIFKVTSWYVATTCPWLPETKKSGKSMEKTQPETTTLSG